MASDFALGRSACEKSAHSSATTPTSTSIEGSMRVTRRTMKRG